MGSPNAVNVGHLLENQGQPCMVNLLCPQGCQERQLCAQLWACSPVKERDDKVSAPGRSKLGEDLTDRTHSDLKLQASLEFSAQMGRVRGNSAAGRPDSVLEEEPSPAVIQRPLMSLGHCEMSQSEESQKL